MIACINTMIYDRIVTKNVVLSCGIMIWLVYLVYENVTSEKMSHREIQELYCWKR